MTGGGEEGGSETQDEVEDIKRKRKRWGTNPPHLLLLLVTLHTESLDLLGGEPGVRLHAHLLEELEEEADSGNV